VRIPQDWDHSGARETDSLVHVDIYECATCSEQHLPGCPMCHFEGGLIGGVLETLVKRATLVHEVSCIGGLGDVSCGFDLEFS
jgi:predicted hydrocarbon binding protein